MSNTGNEEDLLGAVWLVFGAEFRRRWRSWLILAALIAVVGGLVLGATAAGRRTASAFPRFVAAHGYDFIFFNLHPVPGLANLPEVASVTAAAEPFNGNLTCTCSHGINDAYISFLDLSPTGLNRVTKLVAGRMPSQSSPDEVLASVNLEQDFGVHIGTVVRTQFYSSKQVEMILDGANLNPTGPTIAFHVVGIETAEAEFPEGQTPTYDFYTTSAFARTVGRRSALGEQYYVRLRHGTADLPRFDAEINAMAVSNALSEDPLATAVTTSIHPQAVGWWVLAALAGLAGLAVIGQALGRQSAAESEEYPTLSALGLPRRQLVVLGAARNLVVAIMGAAGAIIVAFALSPLSPIGEARLAEPSTGFAFDLLVLLLGALGTVVMVMVLGVWPALRDSRSRIRDDQSTKTHASSIATRVAATGAPPSAVIGVRHALDGGQGSASVPVGTALIGTVLAVLALCATAVFGASLSHLTSTPELYGNDYQVLFVNNSSTGGNPAAEVAMLKRDRSITGIMYGTRDEVSVNGVSVFAIAGEAVRGPLLLSTVGGRLPTGNREIALGTTTLRQVGANVGSIVHVTAQIPAGGTRTASFRVVGTVSFPGQFGLGGLGTGAAFTLASYQNVVCQPGPRQSMCLSATHGSHKGAVFARTVSGPTGQATINHYVNTFQSTAGRPTTPASLVNFGEAVNFPLILGTVLVVFGGATLLHLLVVSVIRRRREMGLLKTLGFVNRQVGATVLWQATTVALVGLIVGVPLGIVIGRAVWTAFATNLGAVPVPTVPAWTIVALALGVLVFANLLAVVPAMASARRRSVGQLLRTQ